MSYRSGSNYKYPKNKRDNAPKTKEYLHEMYNATSTDDGKGDIETYEAWLERQLLIRINKDLRPTL